MSWRSKSTQAGPEAGDDVVAKRLAELTHREAALRKITEAMEKQRTHLEEREREAERVAATAAAGDDLRVKEWRRRTEQFERRTKEAEQRAEQIEQRAEQGKQRAEQAERRAEQFERRADQAERRVRELEQQLAAAEARQKVQEAEALAAKLEPPSPPAAPAGAPPPLPALEGATTEGTYTLQRLERIVEEARLRGDPRADEWGYYLPLLREHAEPDGRLPAQFASLVDTVFA